MADGSIIIDVELNVAEFKSGISKLQKIAGTGSNGVKKAFDAIADATKKVVGFSLEVGQSFEAQMSKVKAITGKVSDDALPEIIQKAGEMKLAFKEGADATETAGNIIASMAKKMGAETSWSATQAGEAFEYMAMAGWKTGDMLDGIAPIMNLATAAGEDLGRTSDIVTDAITAFGLQASDATHFADVLAKTSTSANTNVGMMGETFKYVGALCGAMNYTVDDAAAAIGTMANSGIKASQAGTSLRSIISRLAAPTDKMACLMEDLGISIVKEDGQAKSLAEVIQNLRDAFSGMSETEKTAAASILAGKNAMSGMLAIVNTSDEDFQSLRDAIANCDGSAQEMADTMLDNLPGALTILNSATEGLGIAFYETFSDIGKTAVQEFTEYVSRLTNAMNEGGGIDGFLEELASVASDGVARLVEVAPQALSAAAKVGASFIIGIGNSITSGFTSLAESVAEKIQNVTQMMVTLGLASALSFVRGITSGSGEISAAVLSIINSFGSLLSTYSDQILKYGSLIIESLLIGLTNGISAVTEIGVTLINHLASGVASGIPRLLEQVMPMLVGLSGALRANAGHLVDAGINLLQNIAQGIANSLPVLIQTVPTIVSNIAGIINDNAPKLLLAAVGIISTLAHGLLDAIPTLVQNIPEIIKAIVDVLLAFNWIGVGQGIINFLREGIVAMARAIPEAFNGIMDTAVDLISGIQWGSLGADIIAALRLGIEALAKAIPNALSSIMNAGVAAIKSIDMRVIGKMAIEKLVSGITGMMAKIKSALNAIVSAAVSILPGLGKAAIQAGTAAVTGLLSLMLKLPGKVGEVLLNIISKAVSFGSNLTAKFTSIGKNVITGLISGIKSMVSSAYGAIKDTLSGLVDKAKNALGIHSPSTVFRDEVGQWIPKGVASGIKSNIGSVIDATSSLTKSVVSSVKSANGEKTGENYAKKIINGIKKQKKYAKKSAATVGAAIVNAAEKKLKNYQTVHNTTVAYEVGFWKKILGSCKKGTQAYYDAYSNYSSALKTYNKGMADAKKELIDLEESYANDVAKVEEQLINDMNSLWDNYHSTVENRSKELYKSLGGLFSAFSSKTSNTTAKMISNMKSQVEGMTAWQDSLKTLKSRGLDEALLGELKELGPEAAADVALLASMTDAELKSYVDLWKQKMDMCKKQATDENSGLYDETLKQVEALKTDAAKEIQGLTDSFVSSVKTLASKTKAELGGLPKAFKSIGKDSINGITKAIESNGSKLTKEVKTLMTSAVKAAKSELKIKSPSRVFRDEVGAQIPAGVAAGVDDAADEAFDAVEAFADDLIDNSPLENIPIGFELPNDLDMRRFAEMMNAEVKLERSKMSAEAYADSIKTNIQFAAASAGSDRSSEEKLDRAAALLEKLVAETEAGHYIVLDDGTLVGKLSKKMDVALGKRRAAAARGC